MKSPIDAKFMEWEENPEPEIGEPKAQVILDTGEEQYDAYLWESDNSGEGWLSYGGPLAVVQQ